MAKRRAYSFTIAALIALTVGIAFQADGGLLIFHTEESWEGALGGGGLAYNFNSFDANVSFANTYNFGPFRLSAIGVPPQGTDEVVTGPSNETVNGSPFASMFLDSTRGVALDFTSPTLGFGGEFVGGSINFGVFLPGDRAPTILGGPTGEKQFFGIVSTEPFQRIDFLYSGSADSSTTVNLDDVRIGAAVPEPTTLMLLGSGGTLFAAYGVWRRRHRKEACPDETRSAGS